MLTKEPICVRCKYFNIETFTCKAFPVSIPLDIVEGDNNHSKPLPDQDNDIVFEPINEIKENE